MLLAAGRGERMRPLTDELPKPLLPAGGKPLLQYPIDALLTAGVTEFVVNVAWLKQSLYDYLGDGERFGAGVAIAISDEGDVALETGGGILHALPLLGSEPFWLVNGDVYTEFGFAPRSLEPGMLAHLLLVANPAHNPEGDFALDGARVVNAGAEMLTYSGVAVLNPELFADYRGAEQSPARDDPAQYP